MIRRVCGRTFLAGYSNLNISRLIYVKNTSRPINFYRSLPTRPFSSLPNPNNPTNSTKSKGMTESILSTSSEIISNTEGSWRKFLAWLRTILMGRQRRKFRMEDALAIFSWFSLGTSFFILAGTTTAVSLVVAGANSSKFQASFAEYIKDLLSKETGFEISFESAIIPVWREGTIRFKNVSVVCDGDSWKERVKKNHKKSGIPIDEDSIDINWTYWDMTIESVDVTLSLWRWLEGRGILEECLMKGVRGVVDRRHITFDPDWTPTRRDPLPGDFDMKRFTVEDLLLTVLNPNFRPYTVSIYTADLPIFRTQWMLYDIMCAESIVGMFDGCLFSVHKSQEGHILARNISSKDVNQQAWSKMSHLKINGVSIDHMNAGVTGPFGWITSGTVDVDFRFLVPQSSDSHIMEIIRDEMEDIKEVALDKLDVILKTPEHPTKAVHNPIHSIPPLPDYTTPTETINSNIKPKQYPNINPSLSISIPQLPLNTVYFQCDVTINDLRAFVPLSSPHLTYMSNALIRPVVGYLNSHRTKIPLSFAAIMSLSNFDGSWTPHSAGLVDLFGEEIGKAMTLLVLDERERMRQIKRVSIWSLQNATRQLVDIVEFARGIKI